MANAEKQVEEIPPAFEYFIFGYLVEKQYEYFSLLRRYETEGKEDKVNEITDEGQLLKAYRFIKGALSLFESKESKRITRINVYFYIDSRGEYVMFDVQKVVVEKLKDTSPILEIFGTNRENKQPRTRRRILREEPKEEENNNFKTQMKLLIIQQIQRKMAVQTRYNAMDSLLSQTMKMTKNPKVEKD